MSASRKPISPHSSPVPRADQGAAVEAIAGLGLSALDRLITVIVARKYTTDPARILPALRPTPEELLLLGPLVWFLFARIPRRAQVWTAVGVLVFWFVARVALAVEAGKAARAAPAVPLKPAPAPWWKRAAGKAQFWRW